MKFFIFSLIALLCWSGSDFFSKKGTNQQDKFSHWKVIFFVGAIMGAHALLSIFCSIFLPPIADPDNPEWWRNLIYTDFKIMDFVYYLPIAFIYLSAMVVGYVGLRYIELSVSSPICNSSGSLALVICLILGWATLSSFEIVGVILIALGVVGLGVTEYMENDQVRLMRTNAQGFKYTKSLIAILIPVIYLVLDALGTVGDDLISNGYYFANADMSDFASNTAFELTSLCFALFAFCYVKFIKREKFFDFGKSNRINLLIGGTCETVGQIFYMAVMFSDFYAGIPMISAYCAVSVLWSRLFLKEKLSYKHYITIFITIAGILLLGLSEAFVELGII